MKARMFFYFVTAALTGMFTLTFDVQPVAPQDWWPMFRHDLSHTGYSTSMAPETNNIIWSRHLGLDVDSSPAVVDGKVYIGSNNDRFYCLDAFTGEEIWSYSTWEMVRSSPAVVDAKVYVGESGRLLCLNAETGGEIWYYPMGSPWGVWSSPAVADGKVYVGSLSDHKVWCLDASNGDLIWSYTTGDWVRSSPAVVDSKVYVGSNDDTVYCLDAEGNGDGTTDLIWSFATAGKVISSPAVIGSKVYVGSEDHKVYCLPQDDPNGDGVIDSTEVIWSYTTYSYVRSSPAVADGKVYVGSDDKAVYCLDALTGAKIWRFWKEDGGIWSSPAVADGKVYVGSNDNRVYCLPQDDPNGDEVIDSTEVIWSYTTGMWIGYSSPAVFDRKVYVGSHDNKIYAFGPSHILTITTTSGGTTDPPPGIYAHAYGSSVEVLAIQDECYVFDHWELDGNDVGSDNPYSVLMDDDRTLHTVFMEVSDYDLTITATAGGTTDPAPGIHTYSCGSSVEVTAIPDTFYLLDHWELDGSNAGSQNPITVVIDSDHALHAVFAYQPAYDVTINAYCYTESVDVSVSIMMDGLSTGYNAPHTFTDLRGTHTFTVPYIDPHDHPFIQWNNFESDTTITVSVSGTYTAYYGAHHMVIPDSVIVYPGDTARVPVYGLHCGGPAGGCEKQNLDHLWFGVDFDSTYFHLDAILYEVTDPVYASFYDIIADPYMLSFDIDNIHGRAKIWIMFNVFGGPDIPPGEYRMVDLVFIIDPSTPTDSCYPLHFPSVYHTPPQTPSFEYEYCAVPAQTNDGSACVGGESFVRGDVDASGEYSLADGLFFLNYFFNSTPIPICMEACDVDDSGDLTLADGLWFLNYFFVSYPVIPPPVGSAPGDCGGDPTPDQLGCESFPPCGTKAKVVVSAPLVSVKGASEKVVVKDAQVEDGEVVVPVELVNVEDIMGVDITLGYDASVLKAEKVEGGADYDYFVGYTGDAGQVRIGVVPDLEMKDAIGAGERIIAEVVFKVKGDLANDVSISVERADLYGRGVKQVKSEWIGGLVKAGVELPTEVALSQNYPNPFNPTTLIKYDLPVDCRVRLEVYNILGQKVATLVNDKQKAGYKVARWDAGPISSGIYFYRLTAGDFVQARKMVLLK